MSHISTHSAIARRISPEYIQYGNIINDGTLGAPGTENNPCIMDSRTGTFCTRQMSGYYPHEICKGERNIDPKIDFTDYYYIYDLDKNYRRPHKSTPQSSTP